jgi:type I restriction enzyme S subunit
MGERDVKTRTVQLGEVCEVNPATDYDLAADSACTFVPMEAVDDVDARVTRSATRPFREVSKGYTVFAENDVIIAKITPCMENGKCAIARGLRNGVGFGSTEFHVLRASRAVLPEWLHYFWRLPQTRQAAARNMTGSAGQKRVPASFLESLEIPLPSLPEQRRIATQLEQADRLRRTRRYATELSDSFLPAAFLEMLGDMAPDAETVEGLAVDTPNAIRTGPFGSQLLHSEFTDSGVAVLGIDNAVNNRFEWSGRRFITPEKYESLRRYTVRPGDVLITIMGTCGRCAVVPNSIPTAINTKHLCCITLDQTRCLPAFLHAAFLHHPNVRHQLGASQKGAIMDGLNMEIIKALRISVPPLRQQQRFADLVARHEHLRSVQRESLRQTEHLFQSLLHQAFRQTEPG